MFFRCFSGPSYNQPTFSPCATWDSNALTFADVNLIGNRSSQIFVDIYNNIYATNTVDNSVRIWLNASMTGAQNLSGGLLNPRGIFVSKHGDIYVDNGLYNGVVQKWSTNATIRTIAMHTTGSCSGIFADLYDNIYCSLSNSHRVLKRFFNGNASSTSIVAGNGTAGSTSVMLNTPQGIFVDMKMNLYVADCFNHRIQLFHSDLLNGTTIAGNGAPGTITLHFPTGIVLDGNGYLFISEANNGRIVASGPNGFRCIVGCSAMIGNASNQLIFPWSLGFDSYGNLFVVDTFNNRIAKILLTTNSCSKSGFVYLIMLIHPILDPSYNLPKISPCATWNSHGITVGNSGGVVTHPYGMFVDIHNTIYLTDHAEGRVQIWPEASSVPSVNLSGAMTSPYSVFAAFNGDVYVENGYMYGLVNRWSSNTTIRTIAMYMNGSCLDLWVDLEGNTYCSLSGSHQVIRRSVNDNPNTTSIVAGNQIAGSTSDMLNNPRGIFVDVQLNLYVADSSNDRIQLFKFGQRNGTTVAGNGASGTITLSNPTSVVLDVDGYLFIVDGNNNRIIGSGPTGFRCIAACSGSSGNESIQLNSPQNLRFDRQGNLFIVDRGNGRVQKFLLETNSCGK